MDAHKRYWNALQEVKGKISNRKKEEKTPTPNKNKQTEQSNLA